MKKLVNLLEIVLLVGVLLLFGNLYFKKKEDKAVENFRLKQEMEFNQLLAERELQDKINSADRVIRQIQDNVELVLLTEIGDYTTEYDKNEDKWYNGAVDSKVTAFCEYKLIYCIDTSNISFTNNQGNISYSYRTDDIYLKMVETYNHQVETKKGWFGKKFTEQEIATIFDKVTIDIKEIEKDNDMLKQYATKNLEKYISDLCLQFNVGINTTEKPTTEIQYNNPNIYRDTTDYIIIHTTNNTSPTANAKAHFNYWNSTPNVNVSANYVVDENEVINCIDSAKISYGVSKNKWKNDQVAFNSNSINIEMCVNEGADFDKTQQRTIELVKELLVIYPNAQVIRHFDATGKETCPDMTEVEWQNFLSKVKG